MEIWLLSIWTIFAEVIIIVKQRNDENLTIDINKKWLQEKPIHQ